MFVSKRDRKRVRSIAAREWNRINRDNLNLTREARLKIAKDETAAQIKMQYGRRNGFGSLITSIFITILIRIAMKMLENWLEQKLFTVDELGDE
jgi:hypothetical protein